jgi:short-subunit dehydrogenase
MGAALVHQLAQSGARVAAVARRGDVLEKLAADVAARTGRDDAVIPVAHDVTQLGETEVVFEKVAAALGGVDLIIYAAGTMPAVAPEQFDADTDREVVTVNLTAAMAWLDHAATRFQELRSGTIVGIGSMAGERGRRGNPGYGAAKAGLHTYLESLRNRLATKGVKVVTVKPGFIDTEMTKGLPGLFWLISADEAATQILAAAKRGSVTVYVPKRWRYVSLVIRAIPSAVFRWLPI